MKRILSMALAVVMITSVFTSCSKKSDETAAQEPSAKVTIDGTKFMVDGKELWINGVNTPWQYWNDFCGNFNEEFWDKTFKQLSEDNVNCTRIWVNCNGQGVVRLKSTGEVKNINEAHWTDLDKLFAIAEKYKVYVLPTLLSFDHCKDEQWQTLVSSKDAVDSYAEQYVAEFAKRYGDNEYLFGIDIMNEPDWVYENEECGQIEWDKLSYLFGKCAATIHENSSALVTVGMGIIKYNSDQYEGNKISDEYLKELTGNDKAYVDFYSTHYYQWQASYYGSPYKSSPQEFGLDDTKPCVMGENSNDDADQINMTLTEKYKSMHDNGWNGLMVWMEYQEDDESWYCYDLTQEATNAMAEYVPDEIHPLG
jgi:hypothetical protein